MLWWFAPEHLTRRLLDALIPAKADVEPGGRRRHVRVEPLPVVAGLTYEAIP